MSTPDGPILALDAGSPLVSVAVGHGPDLLAERSIELRRSSGALLRLVDEALEEAGLRAADLAGLAGLRGPGSFTGLRVGLATLRGLHEALGVPATALPSFEALAQLAPAGGRRIVAAVDALRGEWFVQPFAPGSPPTPLAPPVCRAAEDAGLAAGDLVVGFQAERLVAAAGPDAPTPVSPGPLAPALLRRIHLGPPEWDPELLVAPLYLRRPAVTLPGAPPG